MKQKFFFAVLVMAVVAVAGCTSTLQEGDIVLDDGTIQKADGTMVKPDGTMTGPESAEGDAMMEGESATEDEAMMEEVMVEDDLTEEYNYEGDLLAGSSSPLIDYNKADYDKALASDKIIFLYFYATWCPICQAEVPHLYDAFDELETGQVVGFRVNFNDGDTDDDERALAQQFQVPYQHYKVILENDEVVLKAPDTWNKERYITEINKVLA